MDACPYCGSELHRRPGVEYARRPTLPGRKSTGMEFVSCPDCDGIIDGFSHH